MQGKKDYQEKLFTSFRCYMKRKRQSTVEPVFGTLKEFLGLRKVDDFQIRQTNKCMHLAVIAYNLKKYLKFTSKVKSGANVLRNDQSTNPSFITTELLTFHAVQGLLISSQKEFVDRAALA